MATGKTKYTYSETSSSKHCLGLGCLNFYLNEILVVNVASKYLDFAKFQMNSFTNRDLVILSYILVTIKVYKL